MRQQHVSETSFWIMVIMFLLAMFLLSCSVKPPYDKPIVKSAKGNWIGGNARNFHLRATNKIKKDSIRLANN